MVNRGGRPITAVVISPSERTRLEQWAGRRKTSQGLAQRARIILRCAAGLSTEAVADKLGITRQTVAGGADGSSRGAWTACSTSRGRAPRAGSAMRRSSG